MTWQQCSRISALRGVTRPAQSRPWKSAAYTPARRPEGALHHDTVRLIFSLSRRYRALHKQHQLTLGGFKKTALISLSKMIDRTHRTRIKLH
ncbi:MAG TPA: hypothetical protein DCP03_01430 [Polaromonas sp.]|nr:hypothetical protein [Polaromonas sp.]